MPRLAFLFVSLMACSAFAENPPTQKSELEGTWQVFGTVTKDKVAIDDSKPRTQYLFRGDKITFLFEEKGYVGIPYHGATIDVTIDRSKAPHRLSMTFFEGGAGEDGEEPETFAYCIYQRSGDKLLLRMLLPLALDKKKDFERFAKDPYPQDFSPVANGYEAILILQKTKNVIPIPKKPSAINLPVPTPLPRPSPRDK